MMYFNAMDCCDGFWVNNGLCIVYHQMYVCTENGMKLMGVPDEAANSYTEGRIHCKSKKP